MSTDFNTDRSTFRDWKAVLVLISVAAAIIVLMAISVSRADRTLAIDTVSDPFSEIHRI